MEEFLSHLKQLNILFIEDNQIMLQKTSNTLELFFSKVFMAQTVQEASEIYYENKIDFILSDIQLQDETIFNYLEKIRKSNYKIPIVLITSYYSNEYLFKASNLSIDGYIVKPLELDQLLHALTKAVKRNLPKDTIIELKDNASYNFFTKELKYKNKTISLGKKERELFHFLIQNKESYVPQDKIINHLWSFEDVTGSAVRNLINRIRSKLTNDIIITNKGQGWKIGLSDD